MPDGPQPAPAEPILSDALPPPQPAWAAAAFAAAIFAAIILFTVAFAHHNSRLEDDQDKFNLPAILQFARQFPRPDLRDYPVASSPGYHLAIAAVARCISTNVYVLRAAGAIFGVLMIATLAQTLYRLGGRCAAALCAGAAGSVYIVTSAGWLLPEDAAWWLCAAMLGAALMREIDVKFFILSGVLLAMVVFTRQSMVWLAAPMWAAAMLGPGEMTRTQRAVALLLATLPAAIVLGGLIWLWHGLTPPSFQVSPGTTSPWVTRIGGISPGSILMTLAMIGLFGTPLIGWFWRGRSSIRPLIAGGAIGLIAGLATPSGYRFPEHRSGIWTIVLHLPTIAGRSPLMIALSAMGGAIACLALSAAPRRAMAVLGATLIAFVAAQMTNPLLWQRYYEPFALIWLALLAASIPAPPGGPKWPRWAGVVALGAMQCAALLIFLFVATGD